MTSEVSIDDSLLVVKDKQKIQASDIDGTFYGAGSFGGSALNVYLTNQTAVTSPSTAAGLTWTLNATLTTDPTVRTVPQMLFSVYVGTDNDTTWLWPDGSNLSSSNRPRINWSLNEAYSDPNAGVYCWSFSIKNESAGAQTYYFKLRVLIPAGRA